ncbi:MAG: ThiF family adenylyltransferase [Oligoflexia bacterium]|nr:ThiF family adenylyltransferase [Oligoflexia bacterium]
MKKNTEICQVRNELSHPFERATAYYPAMNSSTYMKRTARNHHWLGGELGQKRVQKLRVGVAGLGGMGSNIAETLIRFGVGHIRIADPDHIDTSNINRQVIANRKTVGLSKAQACAQELRGIAEDFELVSYEQGIAEETVEEFVDGCDAIVDEIDVFPMDRHVLLHRAARERGIPLYSAYVVGLGIHFYKFEGDQYTFEDFLGLPEPQWKAPPVDRLYEIFAQPVPSYLDASGENAYKDEIATRGAPIFGPATLLGHSVVATRLILDAVGSTCSFTNFPKTPVMPEFLALDPVDFTFKKSKMV